MKKILLFGILSWGMLSVGQHNYRFADASAQWFTWRGPDTIPPIYPNYEKNSRFYVNNNNWLISNDTGQYIMSNINDGCGLIRDSIGRVMRRVYYFDGPQDVVIYDFSKIAGSIDSIVVTSQYQFKCVYAVDSTDSVFLDRNRKRMFVRYNINDPAKEYSDVWIEGIGSLYSFFLDPGTRYFTPTGEETLLCFFEKGQMVYHNPAFDSCSFSLINSVEDISHQVKFEVSPNPATTSVTINVDETMLGSTATITDVTGRKKAITNIEHRISNIETSGLPNGLYFVTVANKRQSATRKFVISK